MVERGPSFEQNSETFQAPQTGGEQPAVTPVEQASVNQEPAVPAPQASPEQQPAQEILRNYNIDAVASGSETPDTLDLQQLMQSQFEKAEDSDQITDAA